MYLGQIVELADSRELFDHPLHPYSKALFDAVPLADPRTRKRLGGGVIEGEAEILPGPGEGCPFYPRCPRRSRECAAARMELRPASEGSSHLVSCMQGRRELTDMTKYIIKRLLIALPTLIGITIIDYAIMCFAGSPLEMMQGARISQAAVAAKEAALGLDKPFYIQYIMWLGQLLQGNMGFSIKSYEAVSSMIGSHLGPTLLLMGVSLIVSLIMSVPAGIYSAIHQYSKGDYAVVTASFFGSSIPGFFLSLLLVYIFNVTLGILPSGGMVTLGTSGGAGDVAAHMVMPVLVLSVSMAGTNIRYIRSAVLEILQQDYLRTARAKGIGRRSVIYKHALRNALVPIVTVIGMQIPVLFGGAVIVEQLFSWPGLGLMTMSAILNRDYPVIMGVCLLSAVVVLLANLVTDIVYAVVNPAIQYD